MHLELKEKNAVSGFFITIAGNIYPCREDKTRARRKILIHHEGVPGREFRDNEDLTSWMIGLPERSACGSNEQFMPVVT